MLITKGSTDVSSYFHLRLAADGTDATGLTPANMDLTYVRNRDEPAAKVDAQALADQDTAHTDNFAIEIDGTNMPGVYRVDWPDAAFATGADKVVLTVKVATAFTESILVQLIDANLQDSVRLGLTALPNAAADAAGGLIISDAGGLDADAQIVTKINSILDDTGTAGVVVASLAAGSITAAVIANGAIDAATFAADVDAEILSYMVDDATRIDASALNTAAVTSIPAILADTGTDGVVVNAAGLAADAANEIADALLDRAAGVETGLTPRQAMRLMAAALLGKASGLGTTTAVFRNTGDTTDRITATVDEDGNRSAVTLDAS